jgi:two-component system sensor histidine kinase/response regulator
MKGFRLLSISILLFLCFLGHAQEDSTKKELAKHTSLAYTLYLNTPDSSLAHSKKALLLALKSKDEYYEAYSYYLLSKGYWVKANYRLSTEFGFKALRLFEQSPHKKEFHSSLLSVARTLVELGNYIKAKELIRQSIKIAKQESDEVMLAESHREYSYLLIETGQLDSALAIANKGIDLFEKMGDTLDASILYSRKSRIFFIKKDYKNSRKYALKGMALDTLVGNRRALAISYFQMAQNEHAVNNLMHAETLLQHSIRINHEIGNLNSLIQAHELLAIVYLDTKRPSLAVSHLQLANQYKDSLYNSEKSGQIQEMQSLYELEGKENTIKLLEHDNALQQQEVKNQQLFLAFLLVGILFLVVIIFFLSRLRSIQNKTNKDLAAKNIAIEQQKEEMQTQAEKLQQLNQLQTKLFSVISHDLRGPISNLQSLLELFTKKLMTAEEFLLISDKLKSNLNVTQRTLENLLNWSLSQMDGIKTEKKSMDINSCIEEASRLMEEVAHRKNVTIHKELKQPLIVTADPDQVQLILRNLIHNGIKFSKIGDCVRISVAKQGPECRVSIHDTGLGMSPEEIRRISGSRQHFTKRGTQQEKGTGLGLLLCKEFIERNDGNLVIKSKPNEGTEVSFTLKLG